MALCHNNISHINTKLYIQDIYPLSMCILNCFNDNRIATIAPIKKNAAHPLLINMQNKTNVTMDATTLIIILLTIRPSGLSVLRHLTLFTRAVNISILLSFCGCQNCPANQSVFRYNCKNVVTLYFHSFGRYC